MKLGTCGGKTLTSTCTYKYDVVCADRILYIHMMLCRISVRCIFFLTQRLEIKDIIPSPRIIKAHGPRKFYRASLS